MIQSALVTGADHGLGLAFAEELLKSGCTVFAGKYASDTGPLNQLTQRYPDKLTLVPLDVSSSGSGTSHDSSSGPCQELYAGEAR